MRASGRATRKNIVMFQNIKEDIASVFDRDPAARSTIEVLTCYPGVHARILHRMSNTLLALQPEMAGALPVAYCALVHRYRSNSGATIGGVSSSITAWAW